MAALFRPRAAALVLLVLVGSALATQVDLKSDFDKRFDGESSSQAGFSVAEGDFNGDGIDDLVVGAPYADHNGVRSGSVYVIYGNSFSSGGSASLADLGNFAVRFDGPGPYAELGSSVAVGNLNADSKLDLVLGAPRDSTGRQFGGTVFVIYGGTQLPKVVGLSSQNFSARVLGAFDNGYAGTSLSVGDVNGDGIGDLIVGAPQSSPGGKGAAGSVYVISGRGMSAGATVDLSNSSAYLARFDGNGEGDRLGLAVLAANVLGIDSPQVIASAPRADNNGRQDSGSVFVLSLAGVSGNHDVASSASRRVDGAAAFEEIGYSLASLDADRDGTLDLAVGAPRSDFGGIDSGSAYIIADLRWANPATDLSSSYYSRFDGAFAGGFLGYAMSAGDLNGDASSDLMLGAYGAGFNNRVSSGSAYYLAAPLPTGVTGLASSFAARFDGASDGDGAGFSVSSGAFGAGGTPQAVIGAYTSTGGSVYLNGVSAAQVPTPSPTPPPGSSPGPSTTPGPSSTPQGPTPPPGSSPGPSGTPGGNGGNGGSGGSGGNGDNGGNGGGQQAPGSGPTADSLRAELEAVKHLPGFDETQFASDVAAIERAIAIGDFDTAKRLIDKIRERLSSRPTQAPLSLTQGPLLPILAIIAIAVGFLVYWRRRNRNELHQQQPPQA